MDSTILNNATVFAINSNEIFNYSQKRKIEILNTNNNLSPLDKNFTYLISFHPISPYSQDATNGLFLEPNDIKCPNTFIDNNDFHYLNKDAFEWQSDSTESFFPLMSYDQTCLYDLTSLESGKFYNCFSLFIYKNKIHQVINDNTTSETLVHCSIDLPNIEFQYNNYYHIILTRNDNIFTMHLILDRYSLFSSYYPKLLNTLPIELHNSNNHNNFTDVTTLINDENISIINIDNNYSISLSKAINSKEVQFTIDDDQSIAIEMLPDEYNKLDGCSIDEHYDTLNDVSFGGVMPTQNNFNSAYNIDSITNVNTLAVINKNSEDGRFTFFQNLPAGTYKFTINVDTTYENYSHCAFISYNDQLSDYSEEIFNKPANVNFKIFNSSKFNKKNYDQNYKYYTSSVICNNNINISNIINDSKITLGYLERQPLDSNLLYKNSFLGYITEFSFYRDQSYLRKFNNITDMNSFQYITDYTASQGNNLNEYIEIKPNFSNIINNEDTETPFSSNVEMKAEVKNNNNIPFKSLFNLSENSNYFSNKTPYWSYFIGNPNEIYQLIPKPKIEYLTNFNISDIILINEKIIKNINNPNDKITQIEYSKNIDSTAEYEYTSNNLTINNKTFCIFTFDILKNILSSDGYDIYDQKKYLMRKDYTLEEYDELKTYNEYLNLDSTHNYIQPIDFDIDSLIREYIINALNSYIIDIKNNPNNLYIIKFVIQLFRDCRYMFIYKLTSETTNNDRRNFYENNIDIPTVAGSDFIDDDFNIITEPYYTNLNNMYGGYLQYPNHYYNARKPLNQIDFNGKQFLYHNMYYSSEKQSGTKQIQFALTNDMYDVDFNPLRLDNIYNCVTPTLQPQYQDYIDLTYLNYNKIRISDLQKNVYYEISIEEYINNYGIYLNERIDSIIVSDGTMINEFNYDPNIHYYIDIYNNETGDYGIVFDYHLFQNTEITRFPNISITEIDSFTYKIDYTNVKTNDTILYLFLDFIDNYSDILNTKQPLAIFKHSHDYAKGAYYGSVLPEIKYKSINTIFDIKYDEQFEYNQSIRQFLPLVTYNIYSKLSYTDNSQYNSFISNLLINTNYEPAINDVGEYKSDNNEYIFYYNSTDAYEENFFSRINILYDNDKRTITDYGI